MNAGQEAKCEQYAIRLLRETLKPYQFAALAVLVKDNYPVEGRAQRGFLERLGKLTIRKGRR